MTVSCPHCRRETFTVIGWSDLDRCGECGKPLGSAQADEAARLIVAAQAAARKREHAAA